jgi:catechol 2,3-dioxygenase-like lactoylglutathione lyase family enzyme
VALPGRVGSLYWGAVLDAPDPQALARFYSALLGWPVHSDTPTWATIKPPDGVAYLGFHVSPSYVPPAWPPVDGAQQMMLHLDVETDDLDAAVRHALEVGATLAAHQPQEQVRVLLDPVGHPFCLYLGAPDV